MKFEYAILLKSFLKGDIVMKKIAVIIYAIVISAVISGCTVEADADVELTYPVLDEITEEDDDDPYRFEVVSEQFELEEPVEEIREAQSIVSGGASWIYAKTQDGKRGHETRYYKKMYNRNDELLSTTEIEDRREVTPTENILYEGGQRAQPGAFYHSSRITRYGADCYGCNIGSDGKGGTSAGIGVGVDSVRQKDGTWKPGITYEGYYIIATSASIPLCTIVEISDHTVSGMGITPGVPFKAIVLDRGGAIQGSKIDLFVGTEHNMPVTQGRRQDAEVKIISMPQRYRSGGMWNCDI